MIEEKKIRHYAEIDLLRIFAAMMVLAYHFAALSPTNGEMTQQYPELFAAAKYGSFGVSLFFIISGFVIALSTHGRSARQFIVARAKRLYPAYLTCCTLTTLTIAFSGGDLGLGKFLANMTLFQPYFGVENIDGVYWSLHFEIRFYLFVAFILWIGQRGRVMWFMAAWLAASAINLAIPIPRGLGLFNLAYGPLFVAGVIYSEIARKTVKQWHYGLLFSSIFLSAIYAVRQIGDGGLLGLSPTIASALLLSFHGLVWSVAAGRLQLKGSPALTIAGAISYPLYLLHNEIGLVMFRMHAGNRWIELATITLAMLILAWAVTQFVEKPAAAMLRGSRPTQKLGTSQ